MLPSAEHYCGESTVNRKLSALSAFYQHAGRSGIDLSELLVAWQPAGRRGTAWKPFLHHITRGQPQARRTVALKAPRKLPRVLTLAEMQAILDACDRPPQPGRPGPGSTLSPTSATRSSGCATSAAGHPGHQCRHTTAAATPRCSAG
jgi:integrase